MAHKQLDLELKGFVTDGLVHFRFRYFTNSKWRISRVLDDVTAQGLAIIIQPQKIKLAKHCHCTSRNWNFSCENVSIISIIIMYSE